MPIWRRWTGSCSKPPRIWAAGPGRRSTKSRCRLSRNGILAGSMLVFIPAVGEFVIPALLGGPNSLMIGRVLWDEFFSNRAWPVASAVAILLLHSAGAVHDVVPERAGARDRRERDELPTLVLHPDLPRIRLRLSVHPDPVDGGVLVQRLEAGDGVGCGELADAEVVLRAAEQRRDPRCGVDFAQGRRHQRVGCGDPRHAWPGLGWRASRRVQGALHAQCHDHRAAGDARSDHRPVAAAAVRRAGADRSAGPRAAASPP